MPIGRYMLTDLFAMIIAARVCMNPTNRAECSDSLFAGFAVKCLDSFFLGGGEGGQMGPDVTEVLDLGIERSLMK